MPLGAKRLQLDDLVIDHPWSELSTIVSWIDLPENDGGNSSSLDTFFDLLLFLDLSWGPIRFGQSLGVLRCLTCQLESIVGHVCESTTVDIGLAQLGIRCCERVYVRTLEADDFRGRGKWLKMLRHCEVGALASAKLESGVGTPDHHVSSKCSVTSSFDSIENQGDMAGFTDRDRVDGNGVPKTGFQYGDVVSQGE